MLFRSLKDGNTWPGDRCTLAFQGRREAGRDWLSRITGCRVPGWGTGLGEAAVMRTRNIFLSSVLSFSSKSTTF